MDGQQQLGVPALEAVNISAWWSFPTGWVLRVVARRSGRSWREGEARTYEHLSTAELVDVLAEEVAQLIEAQ